MIRALTRLDDANPRRILLRGVLGTLPAVALLLAQQLVLGRSPFGEPGDASDVWVAALHCFGAAYLPAAYLATVVSGRRSVADLRSHFGPDFGADRKSRLPPFGPVSGIWILSGIIGVFLTFLGPWLTEPHLGGPLRFWMVSHWAPEVWWHRLLGLWIGGWLGWFTLAVVQVSWRLSRLAGEIPELDLFDLAPLRPFVHHGLSNGLAAALLATFIGLLGLDQGLTVMLFLFGGMALVLVAVVVALPLLGVRARIRATRARELAWCDQAIREARDRVRSGAEAEDPSLSDLMAFRSLVEGVGAWPMDVTALRRATLYLLIPLGSWTASALVQEVVERAVGGP